MKNEVMIEKSLTGHIYYGSPYESYDSCGTCDGANCHKCKTVYEACFVNDYESNETFDSYEKALCDIEKRGGSDECIGPIVPFGIKESYIRLNNVKYKTGTIGFILDKNATFSGNLIKLNWGKTSYDITLDNAGEVKSALSSAGGFGHYIEINGINAVATRLLNGEPVRDIILKGKNGSISIVANGAIVSIDDDDNVIIETAHRAYKLRSPMYYDYSLDHYAWAKSVMSKLLSAFKEKTYRISVDAFIKEVETE